MRNADWLDDLARSLSHGLPRRGALRAAAAALMAGFLATFSPSTAPTKRNKNKNNKKHRHNNKNKRKRRKKKKDRGKSQQTGSCTFDQTTDASVLLVEVAESFEGKPLTLVQRATVPSVGDFTQQLVVNLGQQLVVQLNVDQPDDAESRLRALYGTGFTGIQESVFIIILEDGAISIGGSIDGRALVARAIADVEQDPDGWEFADGGPPPVTTTDPDLLSALQSVLDRATDEVANCAGDQLGVAAAAVAMLRMMPGFSLTSDWLGGGTASAQKAKRKRSTRTRARRVAAKTNPTVCDEASDLCLTCWAGCFATLSGCCAGTFGLGCGFCYVAYEGCLDLCDAGVCCPVECGNDLPSSCCCEGETCCEDNCCEKDETCFPGGVCCKDGVEFCLGTCCPQNTFCKEGICCRENEEPCFGECCPSGETCREPGLCCPREVVDCDGVCCPSELDSCQGSVCCPAGQIVCGTTCCAVDDICKPPDDGGELKVCCPKAQVCGKVCCDELSGCLDAASSTCCSIFSEKCGKTCCDFGEVCLEGQCCPNGQACGKTCCPANNFCADPGKTDCRPCDEGQVPCPFDIEGAPDCCPPDTLCCGDGTCCPAGSVCCERGCCVPG